MWGVRTARDSRNVSALFDSKKYYSLLMIRLAPSTVIKRHATLAFYRPVVRAHVPLTSTASHTHGAIHEN